MVLWSCHGVNEEIQGSALGTRLVLRRLCVEATRGGSPKSCCFFLWWDWFVANLAPSWITVSYH